MNVQLSPKYQDVVPKITIITVCFNARDDLEDTIRNVAEISYPNLEYIVIDGGSTDGTVDLLLEHNHVINRWISEPDNGIYDAMNKGWLLADCDSFIIFLGAGDKLLSVPNINWMPNSVYYGDVMLGNNIVFNSKISMFLILGNSLHHQALLVPKSLFSSAPFDVSFKTYADFDLNQRLYKRKVVFTRCDTLLGYAKPDGVSANLNIDEMISVVRKNYGLLMAMISRVYLFSIKLKHTLLS